MNNSLKLYPPEQTEVKPKVQIIRQIPKTLNPQAIEFAVREFVKDSHSRENPFGLYKQTIESIAASTFLNKGGDFWLAEHDKEVAGYVMANVIKDSDQLTYWVNQAYVAKDFRSTPVVKEWWNDIKHHAKRHFCKKLVIVSSRSSKAYERWFATGMKEYAVLMSEELGE